MLSLNRDNFLLNIKPFNNLINNVLRWLRLRLLRVLFVPCSTFVRLFCDSYKVEEQSENSRRRPEAATREVRRRIEGGKCYAAMVSPHKEQMFFAMG